MKLLILSAAAVVALSLLVEAATPPRAICHKKITNCCFKYAQCGYDTKKIPEKYPCNFEECKPKCDRVCPKKCKRVRIRVPVRVCTPIIKTECKKRKVLGIPVPKCKTTVTGKKCTTVSFKWEWKTKCETKCVVKCKKVCRTVNAVCTKVRTVKFAKFCPTLQCEKQIIVGNASKPTVYVSEKEVLASATRPVRTILVPGKK